jgi:predicted transcriptional regulator
MTKPARVGALNLSWSPETEARARRLAREQRRSLAAVVAAAIELLEERHDAEQAAIRLHYARQAKRRAS